MTVVEKSLKINSLENELAKVSEEKTEILEKLEEVKGDSEKLKQCQICLSAPLSRSGLRLFLFSKIVSTILRPLLN